MILFKRNSSFLLMNFIFTISYLVITYPYLQFEGLALKALLIVLFTLNTFLLLFPQKLSRILFFILLALTSTYFGIQTIYFRTFNQYGMITTALSVQSNMFKFAGSLINFIHPIDVIYVIVPFLALYIILKIDKNIL